MNKERLEHQLFLCRLAEEQDRADSELLIARAEFHLSERAFKIKEAQLHAAQKRADALKAAREVLMGEVQK